MDVPNQGGIQAILKLSSRSQYEIVNKHEQSINLEPESMSTRVYVGECSNCQMTLVKKAANLLIENCQDLVIIMSSHLVSGTLEVVKSSNISIKISPKIQIPTVTVDSTSGLKIILLENQDQIESLYFHKSSDLNISIQGDGKEKDYLVCQPTDAPEYYQFISHWEKTDIGFELKTEKVFREGIYPKAEGEFLEAKKRDRENAEKAFKYLEDQFKMSIKHK